MHRQSSAPTSTPRHGPVVGLFIRPWHTVARDILAGVRDAAERFPGWSLFAPWPDVSDWRWPRDVRLDGVIVDQEVAHETQLRVPDDVPAILCGHDVVAGSVPSTDVSWNEREVGELAADHLLEQGFGPLCVIRDLNKPYHALRCEGFTARAAAAGVAVLPIAVRSDAVDHLPDALAELPRPTGVFAASDRLGHFALRSTRVAGIRVPEDLAVVGAGNDELFCEFTHPPLSSVALPGRECGAAAAKLLADALEGRPVQPVTIPPEYVAIRHSTDMLAVDDPVVVRSLRRIRDHAAEGLEAADVHANSGVAKRTLEIRFRRAVGRTIGEEIARTRVEHAKRLLRAGHAPVSVVAARAGFSSPERLDIVFRRLTGSTPTRYREAHKASPARE